MLAKLVKTPPAKIQLKDLDHGEFFCQACEDVPSHVYLIMGPSIVKGQDMLQCLSMSTTHDHKPLKVHMWPTEMVYRVTPVSLTFQMYQR